MRTLDLKWQKPSVRSNTRNCQILAITPRRWDPRLVPLRRFPLMRLSMLSGPSPSRIHAVQSHQFKQSMSCFLVIPLKSLYVNGLTEWDGKNDSNVTSISAWRLWFGMPASTESIVLPLSTYITSIHEGLPPGGKCVGPWLRDLEGQLTHEIPQIPSISRVQQEVGV